MKNKITLWVFWLSALIIIAFIISFISLYLGSTTIPFKKIVALFFEGPSGYEYSIIFNLRLPRIILSLAIGGALSLCGVILQGMFRNPLVEPYTFGISGGAAMGVCLAIVLRLHRIFGIFSLSVFGFLGAGLVIVLLYYLSIRKGVLMVQGLLLTGVMISFISSSLIMLIMAISHTEDMRGIIFWIMGSLQEPNWLPIIIAVFVSLAGLIASYFFCFDLNAFSLGEEEAMHLGINIEKSKRSLFLITSLLTGCSVSVTGIIGFVGLVIPHFMRLIIGSDHRILLISSYIAGGIFLLACDTVSRMIISPLELPVGVITGIVGGIIFIYFLTKKQIFLQRK